jgi:pimeloyl-ACP methyl ester carboxylesterase
MRFCGVIAAALLALASAGGASAQVVPPLAVVFVGGIGADLEEAAAQFEPLKAAILEREPNAVTVQYSYNGSEFDGCTAKPLPYSRLDTSQNIEVSKRVLRETLTAFEDACHVGRVAIIGHSLGGLIAFQALDEVTMAGVSDLVTIDSPLGGVPPRLVQLCIDVGVCDEGPVVGYLADLPNFADVEASNAARAAALASGGVRMSAWGNESDCFYNAALCSSLARALLGVLDARETQWLGIPDAVHKDFALPRSLSSIGPSHTVLLRESAKELATALTP